MAWPLVPLDTFCTFSGGGKLKLNKADYVSDGITAYSAAGPDGYVAKCEFTQPAIVVSSIGARCGKAFLALGDFTTLANTYVLFPDLSVASPNFLWYQLNDEQSWIRSGTAQPFIKPSDIKARKVILPPLSEQQRIVDILDRAAAIQRLRRAAEEKAREIIPSLFVDMFGDPATNPKGWPVLPMRDLFVMKPNYGTMTPASDIRSDHLCIRVANIQADRLSRRSLKYVSASEIDCQRHLVKPGDLLLARAIASVDHLGKCLVANPVGEVWAFDSHVMRCRFDTARVSPHYVANFLRSQGGRAAFLSNARQSAIQHNINSKEFGSIAIPVPPVALQCQFERAVQQLDSIHGMHSNAMTQAQDAASALTSRLLV